MTNLEIEAFRAIMRYGSISKAAEFLFISQPALSLRIKNLENELGCKLFIRKKGVRNIELTDAGKRFVELADRWSSFWQDARRLPQDKEILPFRVAALNSISCAVLPRVFTRFINRFPSISLETDDLSSYASYDAIEAKEIDLAFIVDTRYSIQAICVPLLTEEMYLITNTHLGASLPDIVSASDLDIRNELYCPWFLEFEQWHRLHFGKDARPLIQLQIQYLIKYFFNYPKAWGFIPASLYEIFKDLPYIEKKPVAFELPKRTISYLIPEGTKSERLQIFQFCLFDELNRFADRGIVTLL